MDAAFLTAEFRKVFPVDHGLEHGTGRRNEWTITHSFFAAMGGFEVVVKDKAKDFLPTRLSGERRTGLTLTTEGLRQLAKEHPHLIEDIPVQQIQDKSKGSGFAKTLVCMQGIISPQSIEIPNLTHFTNRIACNLALWFSFQCIARFKLRLGISLLELNTFGHAICTLAIYLVWWRKPLDIQEPLQVHISDGSESEAIAVMCMASKLGLDEPEIVDVYPTLDDVHQAMDFQCELIRVDNQCWRLSTTPARLFPSKPRKGADTRLPLRQTVQIRIPLPYEYSSTAEDRYVTFQYQESTFTEQTPRQRLEDHGKLTSAWDTICAFVRRFRTKKLNELKQITTGYVNIPTRDLYRYFLAASNDNVDKMVTDLHKRKHHDALTDRVRNSPKLESIRTDWMLYFGFGFVGLVYGGLHCIAWEAPFETEGERLLWRISSVAVAANGFLLLLLYTWELSPPIINLSDGLENLEAFIRLSLGSVATHILDESDMHYQRSTRYPPDRLETVRRWALDIFGVPMIIIVVCVRLGYDVAVCGGILVYIAARVFLVVECFVNFAHLPESAYITPQWSRYVPHIG